MSESESQHAHKRLRNSSLPSSSSYRTEKVDVTQSTLNHDPCLESILSADIVIHGNINADTAAARIAGELGAESLISMTDIEGILRDKNDPSTLISQIYVSEAPQLVREGVISGGMIPKVNCSIEAIRRGVGKVFIIDGRIPHAILIETLTDEGIGTMFLG